MENGPKACEGSTIKETDLQAATVRAINLVLQCSSSMMDILMENIKTAIADDNSGELATLNTVLAEKQKELLKLARAKKDYTVLADEIDHFRDRKQELLAEKAKTEAFKKRINEMEEFIKQQDSKITEYDETLVRKYIKEIVIYDDKFHIIFKSGIEIDIPKN